MIEMNEENWIHIKEFYGKNIVLLECHREGITFIYEGKKYDTQYPVVTEIEVKKTP